MTDDITLINDDCLSAMETIKECSIDMILCDLPYGSTACSWDICLPFERLWFLYNRVIKPNGAIVLFGSEPFSSHLRLSNLKNYKYDWIWKKDKSTGHLNCKKQPMRQTELISVFYNNQCNYYPQYTKKSLFDVRPTRGKRHKSDVYGVMDKESTRDISIFDSYPKNILVFDCCLENGDKGLHPTQKPVSLIEYLINTYTLKHETVLDNTMGSGTTGVACVKLGRKFIGIEKDAQYFEVAKKRIYDETAQGLMF